MPIGLEFGMYTFLWNFQLSALGDLDWLERLITCALWNVLDLLDHVVAFQHLSEHDVLAVEPTAASFHQPLSLDNRERRPYLVTTVVMKN
jgi:hypothetical protein